MFSDNVHTINYDQIPVIYTVYDVGSLHIKLRFCNLLLANACYLSLTQNFKSQSFYIVIHWYEKQLKFRSSILLYIWHNAKMQLYWLYIERMNVFLYPYQINKNWDIYIPEKGEMKWEDDKKGGSTSKSFQQTHTNRLAVQLHCETGYNRRNPANNGWKTRDLTNNTFVTVYSKVRLYLYIDEYNVNVIIIMKLIWSCYNMIKISDKFYMPAAKYGPDSRKCWTCNTLCVWETVEMIHINTPPNKLIHCPISTMNISQCSSFA